MIESIPRSDGETLLRFGSGAVEVFRGQVHVSHVALDFAGLAARPFLKWPGGKQWLAPIVDRFVRQDFAGRYYEPFLGGGAVFFSRRFPRATLADVNSELIAAYRAVRDTPSEVIAELRAYPHCKEFYMSLRSRNPDGDVASAARLIYLNKTAFNGMYRVNAEGGFNVPFGSYTNPTICNAPRILEASRALRGVTLRCVDFAETSKRAREGDIVYFDPPYITGHHNNGFRKYNANLFGWDDQIRLSQVARRLSRRGVRVVVSNADHVDLRRLYAGFTIVAVERRSLINASSARRRHVPEALYVGHPDVGQT